MSTNPNSNRGPWCVVCGIEMGRPNHRFQARVNEANGFESYRYHGGALAYGFSPICGEGCLTKAISEWASPPRPTSDDADFKPHARTIPITSLQQEPVAA